MEAHRLAVLREHAVDHQGVDVNIEIQLSPEPLQDRHRPATAIRHPGVSRPPAEEPDDRPHGAPHNGAAEIVIPGQPIAEAVRQAQDPLAHGHRREHLIDEMGSALGHTPPTATRAKPPPVAGERDEPIEPTPDTPEPREASTERATSQKVTKLLFHEAGEALPVAEVSRLREKRLKVFAHHVVQDARRGLPRLVGR